MGDFLRRARTKEILCFSPPENILPFSPTFELYCWGNSIITSCIPRAFVYLSISYWVLSGLPYLRFYSTVPLKRYGACETKTILSRKVNFRSFKLCPSNNIYPCNGSKSLNMRFSIVLLPDPLSPMTPTNSPGFMTKEWLSRTWAFGE